MTFTYTLTCTLDTTTALPPVAGSEEQRAYWVTPTILAWPLSLLPRHPLRLRQPRHLHRRQPRRPLLQPQPQRLSQLLR